MHHGAALQLERQAFVGERRRARGNCRDPLRCARRPARRCSRPRSGIRCAIRPPRAARRRRGHPAAGRRRRPAGRRAAPRRRAGSSRSRPARAAAVDSRTRGGAGCRRGTGRASGRRTSRWRRTGRSKTARGRRSSSISAALRSVPRSVSARRQASFCWWRSSSEYTMESPSSPMPICSVPRVAHQAAGVQADGVIDGGQRRIRRREQVVVVARMIEQQVEGIRRDAGRAEHEGHFAMHLAEHDHRAARRRAARCTCGQQVDGDVGIAAETDLGDAADGAPRHHVRDDVHAAVQQLARHVRVVRRSGNATARACC